MIANSNQLAIIKTLKQTTEKDMIMTMISQPTRSAARQLVKDLAKAGKPSKVIDMGSHLKGSQRWFVDQLTGLVGTLAAPVKPTGCDKRHKMMLNRSPISRLTGKVSVFVKHNKLVNSSFA